MDVGRTLEGRAVGSGVVNASTGNPVNRLPRCHALAFLINPALFLLLGCVFVGKLLCVYLLLQGISVCLQGVKLRMKVFKFRFFVIDGGLLVLVVANLLF